MCTKDLFTQIKKQSDLKEKSRGIIEAIEYEKKSLFNFDDILDLTRDKISRFELDRKIERLKTCATVLEWRQYGNEFKLHNANFCRQPDGCPICAKRLQLNRVAKFKDPITRAAEFFKYAYFITFTIKNTPDLRIALNDLTAGLKRFRRQGQKRKNNRSPGEWGKVRAGILSIETKRGKDSGLWHPHAHGLVFTNEKIDYKADKEISFNGKMVRASKLTIDWNRATIGESINIDCRPLFGRKIEKKGKKIWQDIWSQSIEILKYNTKLLDRTGRANAADIATVLCAGYQKRKFNTYGEFRNKDSVFYCGKLEPYESEIPQGFSGRPKIFAQYYKNGAYGRLSECYGPILEEMKKSVWRSLAGQIMGKFKKRKYRILKIREFFIRRNRLDDFDKALEINERRKLQVLQSERDSLYKSDYSFSDLCKYIEIRHFKMRTKIEQLKEWYRGVDLINLPPAAI